MRGGTRRHLPTGKRRSLRAPGIGEDRASRAHRPVGAGRRKALCRGPRGRDVARTRARVPSSIAVQPAYSLWQMVQYMTKLGAIGFGGPVALVGYMHRDLVEER